ncbi:MAG: hypothetical protein KBF43_04710 [Dermatophilaceae bacterium]|nr:hypothetical protein [Actinomycetales bacterium]MBP8881514.1 hypothetical protein [Dermatophilaceae bacterium]MBP9917868.1 hypothetical protein [Dermatophilaceae bacterium]
MIVDCASCPMRGVRCDDCVVTVLSELRVGEYDFEDPDTAPEPRGLALDAAERLAVGSFVAAGLLSAGAARLLRAERLDGAGQVAVSW